MAQPATGEVRRSPDLSDASGAVGTSGPGAARRTSAPRARRRARLSAYDLAACGLLACIALIFGYVEAVFPLPVPVPGVKLGLGNVVVLFALVAFGWRAGLLVMLVKVAASALLFGNPTIFLYSLAGGALSFAAMCAGVRSRRLSVVGVSMLGGAFHMAGQLAVVALVLAPYVALTYLPALLVVGLATGLLIGYICRLVIRTVGRSSFFTQRRKRLARAGRHGEPARAATGGAAAPATLVGTDGPARPRAAGVSTSAVPVEPDGPVSPAAGAPQATVAPPPAALSPNAPDPAAPSAEPTKEMLP